MCVAGRSKEGLVSRVVTESELISVVIRSLSESLHADVTWNESPSSQAERSATLRNDYDTLTGPWT